MTKMIQLHADDNESEVEQSIEHLANIARIFLHYPVPMNFSPWHQVGDLRNGAPQYAMDLRRVHGSRTSSIHFEFLWFKHILDPKRIARRDITTHAIHHMEVNMSDDRQLVGASMTSSCARPSTTRGRGEDEDEEGRQHRTNMPTQGVMGIMARIWAS
uniref:Uncharacterized protein n=1 Tax=Zea mays TaxID=4577 RepID=C4IYH6_MAIZE|nr:unknown [Zea mays]|eukprot:NP_001170531.1 uncharacterized protein LOC100384545 [Zea mays]